jgi:hypothetical protein
MSQTMLEAAKVGVILKSEPMPVAKDEPFAGLLITATRGTLTCRESVRVEAIENGMSDVVDDVVQRMIDQFPKQG